MKSYRFKNIVSYFGYALPSLHYPLSSSPVSEINQITLKPVIEQALSNKLPITFLVS